MMRRLQVEGGGRVRGGRYAFLADDGFQVVFRSGVGRVVQVGFVLACLGVVGATIFLVRREPDPGILAWLVASLFALAAIVVLFLLRNASDPGFVVVDGSVRRVHLPGGAEIAFDGIRSVSCTDDGGAPMIRLLLEDGELRLLQREKETAKKAAEAVARVLGLPLEC